jgi:phosphoglycolate phosphatase
LGFVTIGFDFFFFNLNGNDGGEKMDSLIFDLDGTLWDSRETVVKAWNHVLEKQDINKVVTKEDFKRTMGLQVEEIGEKLFPFLDERNRGHLLKVCCDLENDYIKTFGGQLYRNVEQILKDLSGKYKLFIVSNCQEGYIEAFLDYHKLDKYFLDFENPGRTGLSKGENIKLVMERNHLQQPAYVGDTDGDQKAATFAGIPFVFARYGFGQTDKYDFAIDRFDQLMALF